MATDPNDEKPDVWCGFDWMQGMEYLESGAGAPISPAEVDYFNEADGADAE